nr:mitochondrial ribosome-associated GTPase 1 isoform X9 [Manis javanica]
MRLPARSLCGAAGAAWRERFPLGGRDVARWFPGHMAKENFTTLRRRRPTKCHFYQLCKGCKHQAGHPDGHGIGWEQLPLSPRREPGGLCPGGRGPKCGQVLPHQLAQETAPQESPFNCAGKATRVGGEPGITRAVMSRIQVCERPLTFLLDTPGVLAPRIESVETGLKLALCAACFQEPCWITWWGRRRWQTTFSTPSTGISSLAVEPHEGGPSNQLTGLADSCIWSSFSQSRPSRWACFPAEMPDHSCWDAGHFELYFLGPVKIPEPCSGTVIWKQFGAVRPGGLEQLPWPRQGPACPNTVGPEASVCTCLWVRPQPLCLSAWGVSFLL